MDVKSGDNKNYAVENIEKLQNKAIRILTFKGPHAEASNLYKESKTDQIQLFDCLYFLRYWATCVLHLFVNLVINFENNYIFIIKLFLYITNKSRQDLNILRAKIAFKVK